MPLDADITRKTLAKVREDKPVLSEVLDAFEPLLLARVETAASLRAEVGALPLPMPDQQRFSDGLSLLSDTRLSVFWPLFQKAAAALMPVFDACPKMPPFQKNAAGIIAAERDEAGREAFLQAVLHQDDGELAKVCSLDGTSAAGVCFVAEYAFSAVLRAYTENCVAPVEEGENPWPLWGQGYCPVCGRLPIADSLAKAVTDEKNPYLLTGGGKKHMHCGLCGCDWLFRRAVCPACGAESKGVMNVLIPATNRSEHIAWCSECKTYTVGVDLRSISGRMDMDAMALGLIHLDVLASEKELIPMCRTFWNQF